MKFLGQANPYHAARIQADSVACVTLVASTEQHFPAPAGATIAYFFYTSTANPVFVLTNGQTAAAPVANVSASVFTPSSPNVVPEINPVALTVTAGTNVSLFSAGTPTVIIEFYNEQYGDTGNTPI